MSSKKEQAKLEPIQVFDESQALSGRPMEVVTREECWERKRQGHGYFVDSGTKFRMVAPVKATAPSANTRFGAIRDESVSPDDETIGAYVDEQDVRHRRATSIINVGWTPQYRFSAEVTA